MEKLPVEVSALVHYLTLNEAGWWDRALTQVVLGCLRLRGEPLSLDALSRQLRDLGTHVPRDRLEAAVRRLVADGLILQIGEVTELSSRALQQTDAAIDAAAQADRDARTRFGELLIDHNIGLDSERVWRSFLDQFLLPIVRDLGARTLRLLAGGTDNISDTQSLRGFLGEHPDHLRDALTRVAVEFLDPANKSVRALVLRELHTHLLLRALALDESSLRAAHEALSERPEFHLVLDTNFLFSALHLHDNPSNDAAQALMGVISAIAPRVSVHLYVHPKTVLEAVNTLKAFREQLRDLRLTPALSDAAASVQFSGIALTFVQRVRAAGTPIDPDAYFDPYIRNLPKLLGQKGIQICVDDSPDVIEDKARRNFNDLVRGGSGRLGGKTDRAWIHDLELIQSVVARRPNDISTPLNAGWWVVTLDQNLIRFDGDRKGPLDAPVCIPPAVVIDLLQFWAPATAQLSEALVSGVRAFATGAHDTEVEAMAQEILRVLSRFESIDDLPRETLVSMLTDMALGARITREGVTDDEKVELVRDALVQEVKALRHEIGRAQESRGDLEKQIERHAREREIAVKRSAKQTAELQKLRARLEADEEARFDLEQRLIGVEKFIEHRGGADSMRIARSARVRFALGAATGLVLGVGGFSLAVGSIVAYWLGAFGRAAGPAALAGMIAWSAVVIREGGKRPHVEMWPAFAAFQRHVGTLRSLFLAVAIEIVVVVLAIGSW